MTCRKDTPGTATVSHAKGLIGLPSRRACPACCRIYPQAMIRTLPTPDSDFTDATRVYPTDFTDETNSLNQIAFE
jgi:hypothetical protein